MVAENADVPKGQSLDNSKFLGIKDEQKEYIKGLVRTLTQDPKKVDQMKIVQQIEDRVASLEKNLDSNEMS